MWLSWINFELFSSAYASYIHGSKHHLSTSHFDPTLFVLQFKIWQCLMFKLTVNLRVLIAKEPSVFPHSSNRQDHPSAVILKFKKSKEISFRHKDPIVVFIVSQKIRWICAENSPFLKKSQFAHKQRCPNSYPSLEHSSVSVRSPPAKTIKLDTGKLINKLEGTRTKKSESLEGCCFFLSIPSSLLPFTARVCRLRGVARFLPS